MHSFTIHLFSSCYCLTTGNGDHVLFKELRSLLVKGLAREPVEWKRYALHINLLFRFFRLIHQIIYQDCYSVNMWL